MPLPLLLALIAAAPTPVEGNGLRCAGGAMIFFAEGSAELDAAASQRLGYFVDGSRNEDIVGFVRIESGGDGFGRQFDAGLSRRRSEAIRDFIAERRHRSRETRIVVGEDLASQPQEADYQRRMGWVAQRLPNEEYARRFPPNIITECF